MPAELSPRDGDGAAHAMFITRDACILPREEREDQGHCLMVHM